MDPQTFAPGFRLSSLDVVVLAVGLPAATGVIFLDFWTGVAGAFVVLHFFVFCNVVRMARRFELIWAGAFAGVAILAAAEVVRWPTALGISLGVTGVMIVRQMRLPSYHGVGWRRVNPELPTWWEATVAADFSNGLRGLSRGP